MKKTYQLLPISVMPGLLIASFLSGHVVNFSQGTHQGGMVGAMGVLIILLGTFIVLVLAARLRQKRYTIRWKMESDK